MPSEANDVGGSGGRRQNAVLKAEVHQLGGIGRLVSTLRSYLFFFTLFVSFLNICSLFFFKFDHFYTIFTFFFITRFLPFFFLAVFFKFRCHLVFYFPRFVRFYAHLFCQHFGVRGNRGMFLLLGL